MSNPATTPSSLLRVGGLVLLVGSIAFVVHVVLRSVVTAGPDPVLVAKAGFWLPINILGVVGSLLVLLGLPAMFPQMVDSGGVVSTIGLALLAVSWAFFGLFLSLYSVIVVPWLADRVPSLLTARAPPPVAFLITFAIAMLTWIVGAVLVASPFIRRTAKPKWVGFAMLGSAIMLAVGDLIIAPSGPAANLALNLLSNTGPVLLLAAFGYLGFRIGSESSTAKPHS